MTSLLADMIYTMQGFLRKIKFFIICCEKQSQMERWNRGLDIQHLTILQPIFAIITDNLITNLFFLSWL